MSDKEKTISHYNQIKEKHNILDKKIKDAYNHYFKDEDLHKMKQEKLHLKEEMFQIEQKLGLK
jgi:uncharacterized protein YdcH (DUF465 family)